MAFRMATPFKHPENGTYYFRRAIPEDLRPAFNGRAEIKRSLRTRDAVEAKRLFAAAAAQCEADFAAARRSLQADAASKAPTMARAYVNARNAHAAEIDASWDPRAGAALKKGEDARDDSFTLTPEAEALVRAAIEKRQEESWSLRFAQSLALFENAAVAMPAFRPGGFTTSRDEGFENYDIDGAGAAFAIFKALGIEGVPTDNSTRVLRRELLGGMPAGRKLAALETIERMAAAGNYRPVEKLIAEIAKANMTHAPVGSVLFKQLGSALYDALIADLRSDELDALRPLVAPVEAPVRQAGSDRGKVQEAAPAAKGTSWSDVFDSWCKTGPAATSKLEWQSTILLFNTIMGQMPVEQVNNDHLRAFRDIIMNLPALKRPLPDRDAYVRASRETPPEKRVSPATAYKRLTALRSLLQHAKKEMSCKLLIDLLV